MRKWLATVGAGCWTALHEVGSHESRCRKAAHPYKQPRHRRSFGKISPAQFDLVFSKHVAAAPLEGRRPCRRRGCSRLRSVGSGEYQSTRANGILIAHHSVGGQRCRRPLARRHNSFRFRHNAVQRAAISLSLCRLHSSLLRPRQRQPCLQRWERHIVASHGNVKHTASRRHVGYGWRSSRAVGQPFPAGVAFLQARA